MNSDIPRLFGFLTFILFAFYGGAFLYSLLHSRLIKKRSWMASIGIGFLWMFLYAWLSTIIADLGVTGLRYHPQIAVIIMIAVVFLPYLALGRLLIKHRKAEQDAAANP